MLGGIVGGIIGEVQYNYKLEECRLMTSDISSYEFTHDVQVNADYNKQCYKIKNHPLAHFENLILGFLAGLMSVLAIIMLIYMVTMLSDLY
jgi:hypothetical protein